MLILKTMMLIHEEFSLFTGILFAVSGLCIFTGVETNLRGVVVSGSVISRDKTSY